MARQEGSPPPGSAADGPRFLSRGYQGAVHVVGSGSGRRVIKSPMGRGLAYRVRRFMLRREYAAYLRLGEVEGVPRCHGLQADGSLVLEYVEGEPFRESAEFLRDRPRYFRELLGIIQAIHAAGVAHGDLKRRGNVLVSPGGSPVLLDFGSAILRGRGPVGRMLFRQACRMDLNAWVKLKYRRRYDAISPEDAACYQPTWVEAAARVVRRGWRKLSGRRLRKARRARRSGD